MKTAAPDDEKGVPPSDRILQDAASLPLELCDREGRSGIGDVDQMMGVPPPDLAAWGLAVPMSMPR